MRIVALCGSLRPGSATRRALEIALDATARAGADTAWAEIDGLPWCDGRDADDYGDAVRRFRDTLRGADAILVGSPEYYGNCSGVLKNALDLLHPEDLKGKLLGLVAVATGDAGAMSTLNQLRQIARWVNAWVLPMQVSIPRAREAFGEESGPRREALETELEQLGLELVRYTRLLAAETR